MYASTEIPTLYVSHFGSLLLDWRCILQNALLGYSPYSLTTAGSQATPILIGKSNMVRFIFWWQMDIFTWLCLRRCEHITGLWIIRLAHFKRDKVDFWYLHLSNDDDYKAIIMEISLGTNSWLSGVTSSFQQTCVNTMYSAIRYLILLDTISLTVWVLK